MSTCHEGSWIGVDLDGTLAQWDGVWRGVEYIGEPIPATVNQIKVWLSEGKDVRIFTARVCPDGRDDEGELQKARAAIVRWCEKHLGVALQITYCKDRKMYELWDDRCVCVERNTGKILGRNP